MKTNKPFFSIIMPVYKTERFVKESIKSVLDQTFTDFELICVNDFTDDDAFNICKEFAEKDKRIACLDSNENVGQSKTRNRGLEIAEGQYVLFLDSDDRLTPDALMSIYDSVKEAHPDCLVFGYRNIYEDGGNVDKLSGIKEGPYSKSEFYSHILKELDHPFISCVGNKAYKMDVIRNNKIAFNSKYLYNEDLGFALNSFSFCSTFYYLNKSFYQYCRRSSGSVMSSYKPNMFYSIMLAREHYLDFLLENDITQLTNFYNVVIGGAFDGLKNEKLFMGKEQFNSEVKHIGEHSCFVKTYEFIKKHKRNFPLKKRLFVSSIKRRHNNLLWSFVR